MIIDISTLSPSTQAWAGATSTADVSVTVDGTTRHLSGLDAAAYLFGQSLGTLRFRDTLDGVQLTDGRFEFPPESGQWVGLAEVADALRYKYGVDPLIEFAPGLGLRGYSVADINGILDLLNREFADQFSLTPISSATVAMATQTTFYTEKAAVPGSTAAYDATAVSTLLDAQSAADLAKATEAELRQELTEGGDLYTDRVGAFYLNGVRTNAMDVAVVSRLLAHDNISSEYKVLMDEYAERNNAIAAARTVIDGGADGLAHAVGSLRQQYGYDDVLARLTAGQFSDGQIKPSVGSTDTATDTVSFDIDPGWVTGMAVRVSATGGGLTDGPRYFVRNLGSGQYSLHSTSNTTTGKVNLTDAITADITPDYGTPVWPVVKSVSAQISGTSYYKTFSLFTDVADWATGTRIRILDSGHGSLSLGTDFYLRDEGGGSYGVFDSLANAQAGGETGRQSLSSNFSGVRILERDVVTMDGTTQWRDGTKVQATTTVGGVTAGMDYYVRNLGTDNAGRSRYSLFDTANGATATGEPRPTSGLVEITGDIGRANFFNHVYDLDFNVLTPLLNTLISNKVRDGDLDQAKLQTLTAQLQNNTEAMTALIKAFADSNSQLVQALR